MAYIAGELPRWANVTIAAAVLLSVAAAGGLAMAALAAVGVPAVVAQGAGVLTLVGGVAVAINRVDPFLNHLQDRRSRRRRLAMGLLATPFCPDRCDCREHLLARAQAAEERACRLEEELARSRK
jgi:hypothetical protein